ncbi:toll-like receptor 4 [Physella acuta]|uniref:toll-like receptor 4 n=1 Tax=Physella acuta TaxID=109671 RepID=UPI0027DC80FD|nr:toll-like receptor 4 [Physella acuta]
MTDELISTTGAENVTCSNCGYITFYMPPNLTYMSLRRWIVSAPFTSKVIVKNAVNIDLFDISGCGFRDFIYEIRGLSGLKTALLSGNNMTLLSDTLFDTFQTIEKLDISACKLEPLFISLHSRRLFQNLSLLSWLDMSSNRLDLLAPQTFLDNKNLRGLNLAFNRFRSIPFDLRNAPVLYILDMRGNSLTSIDAKTRLEMDVRSHSSKGFYLYLFGNTLSCACENIDFLLWLTHTDVVLDNGRNYTCIDNDGTLITTLDFQDINKLWRYCSGQYFFYISIVCFSTLCIGYLLTFIVNNKLTYIVSYVLQYFGNFKLHSCKDYKYGVYIGYADKDYGFACHNLLPYIENKLELSAFVRDRDLLPSSDIARGIVDAVNCSWRVVLVFNDNFLKADDWMLFTIRCAVYSQTPANPARVVAMVNKRHVHQLPTELLSAMVDDNIIVVSRWELDYVIRQKLRTLLCK